MPVARLRARLVALALVSACAIAVGCPPTTAPKKKVEKPTKPPKPPKGDPLPFTRTEERADCDHFDPLKQPFFGETHIHTELSADAFLNGTENDARDAYRFALGAELIGSAEVGEPVGLRRPLDFAVVTDHAEYLGELPLCLDPESPVFDEIECFALRISLGATRTANAGFVALFQPTSIPFSPRFSWCGPANLLCLDTTRSVWQEIQDAAEEFYDRSASCGFTTFAGYEWSGNTDARNLHRNVIFRNAVVPDAVTSYFEAPFPDQLWDALEADCIDGLPGCDVLAIPHNSNISGGDMFSGLDRDGLPIGAARAEQRVRLEPIAEIYQHKASSECFPGIGNSDELCGFETTLATLQGPAREGVLPPPQNFVREALKDGLRIQNEIGVNPFKLGVLAATDAHMANSGQTNEADFARTGHVGSLDGDPALRLTLPSVFGYEASSGGLAVVWAEENSRDAIFEALARREVYATSGTRPIVRLFAGPELPTSLCDEQSFAAAGSASGVPMGGDIAGASDARPPRIAVSALQDPGPPGESGTQLQRIQIIKGWVDANGDTQEAVYDIAGDGELGASVDLGSCTPEGPGFASLCTVWEDPDFDASERAFYYARVLENPSCSWRQHLCNANAVDCSDPENGVPEGFEGCCDGRFPLTLQERAWTSPVWFDPAG